MQRLLAACGIHAPSPEPRPKVVGTLPVWFQRLGAALTVLGLVGGFRLLDRAFSSHPHPAAEQAALSTMDGSAWEAWALRLHLSLNPFGLEGTPEADVEEDAPPDSAALQVAVSTPQPPSRAADKPTHTFRRILATAYCNPAVRAGEAPQRTASNTVTEVGTIALSRDLLRTFNPDAPFDFGDKLLIPGVGIFEVRDTMNPRWSGRADLWFSSPDLARNWGCRSVFATRVGDSAPTLGYQFTER